MARGLRVKRQMDQLCEAEPGCEALVGARHFADRTIPAGRRSASWMPDTPRQRLKLCMQAEFISAKEVLAAFEAESAKSGSERLTR